MNKNKIKIIFEDENILVIDKPSGTVMHPFDFSEEETILDFLLENYPNMFTINNSITLQDGRTISLGGIVHKLDRDTSGVVIIAKQQSIFDDLKKQFTNHITAKKYVALVAGTVEQDSFRIDAPLGRGKKDYKQSTAPINPRGELREAITDVTVLARNEKTTLVELSPITGRTHQLRAHMSSIGHPIVGDKAYGYNGLENEKEKFGRIMLHATSLCCSVHGVEQKFVSPVPILFYEK